MVEIENHFANLILSLGADHGCIIATATSR